MLQLALGMLLALACVMLLASLGMVLPVDMPSWSLEVILYQLAEAEALQLDEGAACKVMTA